MSCFTSGTLILADRGEIAVERLVPGDMILSRDNGWQPIRWIGRRMIAPEDLQVQPNFAPVLIGQGALGDGMPQRDMMVSPQHRLLMTGLRAQALFGEHEVLVVAAHLLGEPGISRARADGISYFQIMFDQHEIIRANGCWSESFQPGDLSQAGGDDLQRNELLALFPDLQAPTLQYLAARRSLRKHETKVFLQAKIH